MGGQGHTVNARSRFVAALRDPELAGDWSRLRYAALFFAACFATVGGLLAIGLYH